MKTIIKTIALLLFTINAQAYSSKVTAAYAIGVFDENGNGENVQHVRKTKNDYNGIVYSKIVVFGRTNAVKPQINIGSSRGHFVEAKSVFNNKKMKIATEMTFKHYGVTKGYFEVRFNKKLYDTKVFVK